MILFTPKSAYLMLLGMKVITSRLWRTRRAKPGSIHWAQLNLKPISRFARLHILSVEEWDGVTADKDFAKGEGFDDPTEFLFEYWSLNEHKWEDQTRKHYKIEFEIIEIHQPSPPITIDGVVHLNEDLVANDYGTQLDIFDAIEDFNVGGRTPEERNRRMNMKVRLENAGFVFEARNKENSQKPYLVFSPFINPQRTPPLKENAEPPLELLNAYKSGYSALLRAQKVMESLIKTEEQLSAEGRDVVQRYLAS